jgi:1-deoxy-D-xylulose-5-phosphate synthase
MIEYKLLNKVNDPKDLKKLTIEELKVYSKELTHFIRSSVEKNGGHYASPLGVVDLTIALHYVYNSPKDKLVWDVGHQAYAHKIITGRLEQFHTLRKKDGLSGYLKRDENKHDIVGAGHASTAISSALGLAHSRDKAGSNNRVVAIVGDGVMTGGLSYEGINNLGGDSRTQLTIVLNDNEMSISPTVGALSKYLTKVTTSPAYNRMRNDIWNITEKIPPSLSRLVKKFLRKTEEGVKGILTPGMLFEELGLRYIGPVNGHDIDELTRTFKATHEMDTPVLVHVYTQKGRGSELAEVDSTKYYAMAGNGNSKLEKPAPDYSQVFGKVATELADRNDNLVCITAAMEVGTGMSQYTKKYPDRYVDVGIAEGHAVTYASGRSIDGGIPIVAIYSTFMQRAYDNVFHDVLLQDLPVIFCMDRSGVVGSDGPTHHGVFDIAYMRMLPKLIVSAPKDGNELRNLLETAVESKKAFSIRYPKDTSYVFDENKEPELLKIGSWEILNKGSKIAILAVGSMVQVAMDSIQGIEKELGFMPTIINARFIKPLDTNLLKELTRDHTALLTVEEGVLMGGFGSAILEYLEETKIKISVSRMGVPDSWVEHAERQQQLDQLGLNPTGILNNIKRLLDSNE